MTEDNTRASSSIVTTPQYPPTVEATGHAVADNGDGELYYSQENLQRMLDDSALNIRHMVPPQTPTKRGRNNNSDPNLWKDKTHKTVRNICGDVHDRTASDWLDALLPCAKWLRSYPWRKHLGVDVLAGLTVGVMVIPQSMSYAKLAGLPVQYGLYSAFVPVYAYAMFGSSRQLAVGPVALLSLMLSTGLSHILNLNGETMTNEIQIQYNILAIQAAFLVGIFYIALGLLRLGFVTIFLSHSVVSGFTSGAAVIIGMSQLKYIFGYEVERSDVLQEIVHNLIAHIDQFNWKTFVLGTSSVVALVALKHVGKTYPRFKWVRAMGPLAVSAFCILLTWGGGLDEKGIPIVGFIPRGLPTFTAGVWVPLDSRLLGTTISMVVVGFMESIAIAKQLASKHKYQVDSSKELIGLGMSNLMGAMFQAYPVTGSFSRSAVNNESGAMSGISGIVTATMVMFVLLFLTSVFEYMPLATLAAIVISGVLGLLDYPEAIYLWKVHKFDFFVWMVSFLGTMFLGVEIGLAIAVVLSLLIVLYESAYPHTAVLGRLPGSTVYRNVKQYPEAETYEGVVLCRIDAPLYFANTQNVREKLQKYEFQAQTKSTRPIRYFVVDMSPVSHVDTTALHILHDVHADYAARGIQFCLSNPSRIVMERLVSSGVAEEIGSDFIFVSVHDAVSSCLRLLASRGSSFDEEDVRAGAAIENGGGTIVTALQDCVPVAPTEANSSVNGDEVQSVDAEVVGSDRV